MAEVAPVEAVTTAPVVPVVPADAEKPKPTLVSTYAGVDWSTIPEETKTKIQEEVDRRIKVARENASRRSAKERDAYWKGRESVRPEAPAKPAEPAPVVRRAPERNDIDPKTGEPYVYEAFLEAKAEFTADAVISKREREREERTAAEQKGKSLDAFRSRVREKFPDIEDRLEFIGHIVMPEGMGDAIAESELGPEILDFLAQNAKECERIAGLSPTAAAREIGKIEARLEKPAASAPSANGAGVSEKPTAPPAPPVTAASTPKQPSAAPAPLKPGGGGGPSDDTPRDTDSIDDWMRKERARQRKNRG